jgi:hypothetical protein
MQCSFQLSHETLYLAVKLMDMFLSKAPKLTKTMIVLAPALGIFVASKIEVGNPFLLNLNPF